MQGPQSKIYHLALWLALALMVLIAGATARFVPEFESIFSNFGSEIPAFTQLVLRGTTFIWVLPIGAAVLLVLFYLQKRPRWIALLFITILAAAWIPTAVIGLYLPVAESAQAEAEASQSS